MVDNPIGSICLSCPVAAKVCSSQGVCPTYGLRLRLWADLGQGLCCQLQYMHRAVLAEERANGVFVGGWVSGCAVVCRWRHAVWMLWALVRAASSTVQQFRRWPLLGGNTIRRCSAVVQQFHSGSGSVGSHNMPFPVRL
jgi:hypothetical protein